MLSCKLGGCLVQWQARCDGPLPQYGRLEAPQILGIALLLEEVRHALPASCGPNFPEGAEGPLVGNLQIRPSNHEQFLTRKENQKENQWGTD